MKDNPLKTLTDWQEDFDLRYGVWRSGTIEYFSEGMLASDVKSFITELLKEAVEAERKRIESLIPEKRNKGFREDIHIHTYNDGFNEAIDIMQEAVKDR